MVENKNKVHEVPEERFDSGNGNSGCCNSGAWNSGDFNSGHYNSGDFNSGGGNSGYWNSGDFNSGDFNSGHYNSGNGNSGDFNITSYATGCFNTEEQTLRFFDKESDVTMEQWADSDAKKILDKIGESSGGWIRERNMSEQEKEKHPEYIITGGYLKLLSIEECCCEWWGGLSDEEKDIIRSIPNFDSEKFCQITGIKA